jgi:hypothetical protein
MTIGCGSTFARPSRHLGRFVGKRPQARLGALSGRNSEALEHKIMLKPLKLGDLLRAKERPVQCGCRVEALCIECWSWSCNWSSRIRVIVSGSSSAPTCDVPGEVNDIVTQTCAFLSVPSASKRVSRDLQYSITTKSPTIYLRYSNTKLLVLSTMY